MLPMAATVFLGFADYFPGGEPVWTGLENYAYALSDDLFWKALGITVVYTCGVVPASLLISLFLAYVIFGLKYAWAQVIFKSAFYLPVVTSGAILSLVWLWLFNPARGLLNYALSFAGLGPYLWTSDPQMALPSLMFMAIMGGHGAAIVLLTAAMGGIPSTYYEAARLDGAGPWRQYWKITLPLLRPTVLYLLVTSTIASFQVFTQVLMMTGGGPDYATTTLVYLIYTRTPSNTSTSERPRPKRRCFPSAWPVSPCCSTSGWPATWNIDSNCRTGTHRRPASPARIAEPTRITGP